MSSQRSNKKGTDFYRKKAPLAERMRPKSAEEFLGQEHLMGARCAFRKAMDQDRVSSLVMWGPPGTGKTTLGRLVASVTGRAFIHLSAVLAGVKDIKEAVRAARDLIALEGRGTILFIDEIHRFNKSQQDALLPSVEDGTLTLIGATTENPSFEVNAALLSRLKVVLLNPLNAEDLRKILFNALKDLDRGLGELDLSIEDEALSFLLSLAMGDARMLLNNLELAALMAVSDGEKVITLSHTENASGEKALRYDKQGEEHFNLISALHKSLRGSDPQAAVYYLMRMLLAGEDPLYIARRMARFASEDVGCADPSALTLAMSTVDAVHFMGMPECDTALAELAVYLATAPKSNALYKAVSSASKTIRDSGPLPVPLKIRNAPTRLMKEIGYAKGYIYPHSTPEAYVPDDYLPDQLTDSRFYKPTPYGFEKEIEKRMSYWEGIKKKKPESE